MKRILTLLLAITVAAVFCISASAQSISTEMPCNLTLQYQDDADVPIANLTVSIYRAADLTASGEIKAVPGFAEYDVSFAEADRAASATELNSYVQRDKVAPDYTAVTDADGNIALKEMQTGVYLITSETLTQGNTILSTQPLLLDLPLTDEKTGVYAYDVTASPKPVHNEILKELNVIVLWKDTGFESRRPDSVTIELYRDGKLFDTQTVNSASGWKYTWKDLSDSKLTSGYTAPAEGDYSDATDKAQDHLINGEHSWYVVERGADGYTVTYAVRPVNNTFVVINTIKPTTTPDQTLPQTGQLWWPVPLLVIAGLLVLTLSHFIGRKRHE